MSRVYAKRFLFASLATFPVLLASVAHADCSPTALACLYTDSQFGGNSLIQYDPAVYQTMPSIVPNDTLSSFVVGPAGILTLCSDWNFGGSCHSYAGRTGIANLPRNAWPFYSCNADVSTCNDWTSSMIIQSTGLTTCSTPPPANMCAFYNDSYFRGNCVWLPAGYDFPLGEALGLANDSIRSMRCGASAQAWVYKNAGFGGGQWNSPYTTAATFASGEDKQISSIIVLPR